MLCMCMCMFVCMCMSTPLDLVDLGDERGDFGALEELGVLHDDAVLVIEGGASNKANTYKIYICFIRFFVLLRNLIII